MAALVEAKKELRFNQEFVQLIEVLKGIAASQFQALSRKKERFEKFLEAFDGFFKMVDLVGTSNPLVHPLSDVKGLLIVTSDEGFMGGLNTKVIHAGLERVSGARKKLFVIGKKGADYLRDIGEEFQEFPGIVPETRYEQAVKIREALVDAVLKQEMGEVFIAYPYPVSFTMLRAEVAILLPCAHLFQKEQELIAHKQRVFVESPLQGIIEYLVGMWISYKLCDLFEDSKLSEFAARTQRLEQSYETLSRKGEILRHKYFRSRHELVDKGMRETFASALLRRKKVGR